MVEIYTSRPVIEISSGNANTGEANTASNVGSGAGIFKQKLGINLEFKSLVAGTGITLIENSDDITISSSGGGAGIWGSITGTLSNQIDLQNALNAKQNLDSTLTAFAAYNTNGLLTQTAADTFTGRSITAASSKVIITNGNGVSGNPTINVDEANFSGIPQSAVTNLVADLASKLTANQTITLSGDLTGSGTTSINAIIPSDTVTFPKIQNITTNKILGRGSVGSGDVEELSIGAGLVISSGSLELAAAPAPVWGVITGTLTDQTDLVAALATKLSTSLPSGNIFIGNGSNVANGFALTGDGTVTNLGVWTNTGLLTKALPALSTGNLRYNGSAFIFDSTTYLTGNQSISITGDATGSGTTAISLVLATVNANVGTFNNVTVNAKGLVTAASNVAYLTANQTITISGDTTGSGTTAITTTIPNDTVTFPKIQNIATSTLLGRSTVGNGDIEVLTVGTGLSLVGGVLSATGTGISGLTTNRIPYATSSTTIGDDSQLTWDSTNNILSVDSISIGRGAGGVSTNLAVGTNALASNTTGALNCAFGFGALGANIIDQASSAFGTGALTLAVGAGAGGYNSAFGYHAGSTVTSGRFNTVIGTDNSTTGGLTTGNQNIVIGYQNSSNTGVTTGSGNIIIGSGITGLSSSLTNNIIFANGLAGSIRYQDDGTKTTLPNGILVLGNTSSPPGAAITDSVALYSVDISSNTTLGIRTETAVVVDASAASSHALKVKINGVDYFIMLHT